MSRIIMSITDDIVERANERTMQEVLYYRSGRLYRVEDTADESIKVSVRYNNQTFCQEIDIDEMQVSFGKAYRKYAKKI